MKTIKFIFPVGLVLVIMAMTSYEDLGAFPRYNDGCQKCHGAFTDDTSMKPNNTWPDSKHNVHRREMLDSVCDACHLDGDNRNPYLNVSNGTNELPGIGCLGCHGRFNESIMDYTGAGLRAHHFEMGMTFCLDCHFNDPDPISEKTRPEYYGKPTVNITHPCNLDGSENWTPDGLGLDNDGDLDYDFDDLDCFGPPRQRYPMKGGG